MQRKRTGAGALCVGAAVALAIAPVGAQAAFGSAFAADEPQTVKRSQTYMESAGAQSVEWPDETQDATGRWRLLEICDPVEDPSWQRPSETRTETESVSVPSSEAQRTADSFDEALEYRADGFAGVLERGEVTRTPRYEVLTRQVDRLVALPDLPSNDVSQLPRSMDFEVTTADALDSTAMRPLVLSDVTWSVSGADELGVPTGYTALCNYRGTEDYLTIPSYEVTCTWSGEVFQEDTQMISSAVYVLEEPFPWWIVGAGMALAGAGASAVAAGLHVRKRHLGLIWPGAKPVKKGDAS